MSEDVLGSSLVSWEKGLVVLIWGTYWGHLWYRGMLIWDTGVVGTSLVSRDTKY